MSSARLGHLGQVRSARLGLTMCDFQLRTVITSLSELRFGCSWALWKTHFVKIPSICLWRVVSDDNLTENLCFEPSVQVVWLCRCK